MPSARRPLFPTVPLHQRRRSLSLPPPPPPLFLSPLAASAPPLPSIPSPCVLSRHSSLQLRMRWLVGWIRFGCGAMAAPASAVSGPGLGGAVRAPRSAGAQRRKRGVELPSPSLLFGRSKGSCSPRAVRVGCSGRRVAMRAAAATGWVMNPEGETDGMPSSAGAVQFEADNLQVRDILPKEFAEFQLDDAIPYVYVALRHQHCHSVV